MIRVTMPDKSVREVPEGTPLADLAAAWQDTLDSPVAEGIVNGAGANLNMPLTEDCTVGFLPLNSAEGNRAYVRSLLFLFVAAASELYPDVHVEVRNSLGTALYCVTHEGRFSAEMLRNIDGRMREYISRKEPIKFVLVSRKLAIDSVVDDPVLGKDRIGLLEMRPDLEKIPVSRIGDHFEFFLEPLLPSTEYLGAFEILPFEDGFVLNYPEEGDYTKIEPWDRHRRINTIYHEAEEWAAMIGCNTISKLNRLIRAGKSGQIVRVAEALQEKKIAQMADYVACHKDKLRFVLIAGPSSSGKTSFSQRLSVQLEVNGLQAIPISMDNYYRNREDTPRKPDGSFDYESIDAIDRELFNEDLQSLLEGKSVRLPKFNFKTGRREYSGEIMQCEENSIFVIEGIHALNRQTSASIPAENKLKIFVSALTPMSIDNYNRIHTTDMRLLRRMVRDFQFRSHDALATIEGWPSVREGEEKYIFPCQEEADMFFNTSLLYEPAVLRKYAEPLLRDIRPEQGGAYLVASRLLVLLSLIEPMEETAIPNNSILKEFIGGSTFAAAL
ncbi:MAG: nucleoside kinase [Succiniclasticum sp.]|nr:nucleoside kinase [Succiniclasticum sp.]